MWCHRNAAQHKRKRDELEEDGVEEEGSVSIHTLNRKIAFHASISFNTFPSSHTQRVMACCVCFIFSATRKLFFLYVYSTTSLSTYVYFLIHISLMASYHGSGLLHFFFLFSKVLIPCFPFDQTEQQQQAVYFLARNWLERWGREEMRACVCTTAKFNNNSIFLCFLLLLAFFFLLYFTNS